MLLVLDFRLSYYFVFCVFLFLFCCLIGSVRRCHRRTSSRAKSQILYYVGVDCWTVYRDVLEEFVKVVGATKKFEVGALVAHTATEFEGSG